MMARSALIVVFVSLQCATSTLLRRTRCECMGSTPDCGEGQCMSREAADRGCASPSAVAYAASMGSSCEQPGLAWCCKELDNPELANQQRSLGVANRKIFSAWLMSTIRQVDLAWSQLELKTTAAIEAMKPKQSPANGEQPSKPSVIEGHIRVIQEIVGTIKGKVKLFTTAGTACALTGKDDLATGCASFRQYEVAARHIANDLMALMGYAEQTLSFLLYGIAGNTNVGALAIQITSGQWFGVPKKLLDLAKALGTVVWKHRMAIAVGFSIAYAAVPLATIMTSTITLTTVSQGYAIVLTTLVRRVFWSVLCPAMVNPFVMGFLVQWAVANILFSDYIIKIVDTLLLPVAGGIEAVNWLRAKLSGHSWKSMTRSVAEELSKLHEKHAMMSWAIYSMLWAMVNHSFNILARGTCEAMAGAAGWANLAENGAEAVTRKMADVGRDSTSWFVGAVKGLMGGSTGLETQKQTLLNDMTAMDAQVLGVRELLGKAVTALHTIQEVKVVASSFVEPLLDHLGGVGLAVAGVGAANVVTAWLSSSMRTYMRGIPQAANEDVLLAWVQREDASVKEDTSEMNADVVRKPESLRQVFPRHWADDFALLMSDEQQRLSPDATIPKISTDKPVVAAKFVRVYAQSASSWNRFR